MTRDSSGVQIVENGLGASSRQLGPILDVAREKSIADLDLSTVTAARLLHDGTIALTDDGRRQLVLADPDGAGRTFVGRQGDGPDEFRGFRGLWRCGGDTLVVRTGISSVKVFTSTGAFVRVGTALMRRAAHGVSTDCGSIAISIPNIMSDRVAPDSETIAWYSLGNASTVRASTIATHTRQMITYMGGRTQVPVPFAESPSVAVGGNQIYIGLGGSSEVRVYDLRGRLVRIVRWTAEHSPVTRDDRTSYEKVRSQLDARVGAGATNQSPSLDQFALPRFKPVFSQLIVDSDGLVWVRKFQNSWLYFESMYPGFTDHDVAWWVFAPSGRLFGTVTTPRDFVIKDIGHGQIVGLKLDSANVPRIVLMPIKPGLLK